MQSRIRGPLLCVKHFLFLSNALVFISGLVMATIGGLGEILYGNISKIDEGGFSSSSTIIVFVGCLITIVGFSGCYGALRESPVTLKLFSYLLVFLMIVEVSLGLWVYFSHIRVVTFVQYFLSQIISRYEMDKDIELLIDKIQTDLQCCGARSYQDWFNSKWNANQQNSSLNIWINSVPHSCCLSNSTHLKTCGDNIGTRNKPAWMYVHEQGCFEHVKADIMKHIGIVVSISVVVVVLEIMALVSACVVQRTIKAGLDREAGDTVSLVI